MSLLLKALFLPFFLAKCSLVLISSKFTFRIVFYQAIFGEYIFKGSVALFGMPVVPEFINYGMV